MHRRNMNVVYAVISVFETMNIFILAAGRSKQDEVEAQRHNVDSFVVIEASERMDDSQTFDMTPQPCFIQENNIQVRRQGKLPEIF